MVVFLNCENESCCLVAHTVPSFTHYYLRKAFLGGGGGLVAKSCLALGTPWTVARQAPLSMGFSRQGYYIRLQFPSSGDLPDPGIDPGLLHCRKIIYQLSYKGSPCVVFLNCENESCCLLARTVPSFMHYYLRKAFLNRP